MKKSEEKVTVLIDAPAEKVWEVISAISGVNEWFSPVIKTCRVEGTGAGAKRICGTEQGEFEETIETVDHTNRVFQYAIPEQHLMPVKNIFGTMKVKKGNNGNTEVEWSAIFDVEEDTESQAKAMFRQAWTIGIQGIEQYIQKNKN